MNPAASQRVAARWDGVPAAIEAAAGCDIVCTATPSRTPVVQRAHVRAGAHINAMGADAEGKQELDAAILQDGQIFVDDWPQASHSGEINVALHNGQIDKSRVAGFCELVAGRAAGRRGPDGITIFDSTGLAIQDLALAQTIVTAAHEAGVGVELDLRA